MARDPGSKWPDVVSEIAFLAFLVVMTFLCLGSKIH